MYSFEKIVSDEIRNSNEISLKRLDSMLHKINKINEIQLNVIKNFFNYFLKIEILLRSH